MTPGHPASRSLSARVSSPWRYCFKLGNSAPSSFSSHPPRLCFIALLHSGAVLCTRGQILLLAAVNTAVSIIHLTHSLAAVAQFTVKLGENAENKGAIVYELHLFRTGFKNGTFSEKILTGLFFSNSLIKKNQNLSIFH